VCWLAYVPGATDGSAWADGPPATADIVTYHHDLRDDPGQLNNPAAVVARGTRLR
jgi:hypothetical protein